MECFSLHSPRLIYAVVKTFDEDGNCILEEYFDDHGRPAILLSGYSALRREYNSNGQWISTTYLDGSLNPVVINIGYASVHRTYNKNDKLETEMYFDADGLPALDTSKKFGIRHEYSDDGRESAVINLDASGNAMNNSSHYAISKNTYTSDGKIVLYYDKDGNPAKLGYGQSGYIYKNGKSICVDQSGRKMFVLRHFLHNSILSVLIIRNPPVIIDPALQAPDDLYPSRFISSLHCIHDNHKQRSRDWCHNMECSLELLSFLYK